MSPAAALAIAALARGDEAWWAAERGEAAEGWRAALRATEACGEAECLAVSAMAHLRLTRVEGSLSPLWHEGAWNRALAACPDDNGWCALARADHAWFVPAFAGGDPARVPALLADWAAPGSLVADAAVARLRMVGAPARWTGGGGDGWSRGMIDQQEQLPRSPGTWTAAVGVSYAPGSGFGGSARFVHPDVGWRGHRLELLASADAAGDVAGRASMALSGAGLTGKATPWSGLGLQVAAWAGPLRAAPAEVSAPDRTSALDGVVTSGAQAGGIVVWAGVAARGQHVSEGYLSAGPILGWSAQDKGQRARASASLRAEWGDLELAELRAELRGRAPMGRGEVRLRLAGTSMLLESTPWWRWPTAGGAQLLRGAPTEAWRAPTLIAAQLEAQTPLFGPVRGAVFADGAYVDGPHGTVGAGLRLVLPPERDNVTRLDVGVGPDGWGVVLAWGEAW